MDKGRKKAGKETICWGCQNFAKCSWARGVPVEGWDATPTKIRHCTNGNVEITSSYCVHSCPQFKADAKQRVSVKTIGDIVNKDKRTIFRYLADKKKRLYLRELLRDKGYILHICKDICDDYGNALRSYYLEKVAV